MSKRINTNIPFIRLILILSFSLVFIFLIKNILVNWEDWLIFFILIASLGVSTVEQIPIWNNREEEPSIEEERVSDFSTYRSHRRG